jgi:hypothetical protein
MRRVFVALVVLAAAGAPRGAEVAAISGACKDRESYGGGWRLNGRSFEDCKAYNQRRDGDNVFDERGFVWWDSRS